MTFNSAVRCFATAQLTNIIYASKLFLLQVVALSLLAATRGPNRDSESQILEVRIRKVACNSELHLCLMTKLTLIPTLNDHHDA